MPALLGLLAAVEHGGLLLWGMVWPLRYWTQCPADGGVNDFSALASGLLVGCSLAAAVRLRRSVRPLFLVTAMAAALPLAVSVMLVLLRVLFLDPVVAYLTLIPSAAAVLCPYGLASLFGRSAKTQEGRRDDVPAALADTASL